MGVDEDRDKVDGADLDADLGAGTDAGRDADGDLASAPQEVCSLDRIVEDLLWSLIAKADRNCLALRMSASFDSPANLPLTPFAGLHPPPRFRIRYRMVPVSLPGPGQREPAP
ncbi:hypothetical protein NicSoilC12_20100 [Arthrobacter sp. NicSoilC12]|nr:hypothetical protein NicSoilC12_20100 [Arthrobacter sp. NicSoilC12]